MTYKKFEGESGDFRPPQDMLFEAGSTMAWPLRGLSYARPASPRVPTYFEESDTGKIRVWTGQAWVETERPAHIDQPPPAPNDGPVIQNLVIDDMRARLAVGIPRYGTGLQPHNGRDALRDAYEEALDLCAYLRQAMYERDGR